jgi:transposase, IS5 family
MTNEQIEAPAHAVARFTKTTRRTRFLTEMDGVIPWERICRIVQRHYPVGGGVGRQPVGVERMLRIYFLQQWYDLSDPAVEEALHDIPALRDFVGVDLDLERAPDETTVCKFRHLLERHRLGARIFKTVNAHLSRAGMKVGRGTIVDATIIHAPSSTKNSERRRDPEMHQTKKGNQWFFGMKAHVGADSKSGLVHSIVATAANVHDSKPLPDLLHGKETRVWGDSAYQGQRDAMIGRAPRAKDFINRRGARGHALSAADKAINRTKSRVRSKVEHAFNVVKRLWGFAKVRYKGISKNSNRLFVMFGLANLFVVRNKLLRLQRA